MNCRQCVLRWHVCLHLQQRRYWCRCCFMLVLVWRASFCGLQLTCSMRIAGILAANEWLEVCCGSCIWEGMFRVQETFETCLIIGAESVPVRSYVIPSSCVSVGIASVVLEKWFGVFEIVFCIFDALGCCLTNGLASASDGGDICWREWIFLRFVAKCLKIFNLGIFNYSSVTRLWCREKWLLMIKILTLRMIWKLMRHVLELENLYNIRQPIATVSANVERSTNNICKRRVWKKCFFGMGWYWKNLRCLLMNFEHVMNRCI